MSLGNPAGLGILADAVHPDLSAAFQATIDRLIGSGKAFGETITIRRGGSSLSAQDVRLIYQPSAREQQSGQTEQQTGRVLVVGDTTLDIQEGDRFNDSNGTLYEVKYIRPNQQAMTVAESEAVQ